jgi:hypothetical protein
MVVNYKPRPVGPLLFFLVFVLVGLIGMPVWAESHLDVRSGPFAVKIMLAPLLGLFYVAMVVRTLRFNARVARDPRAIEWNADGMTLWQDRREQSVPWSQVAEIAYDPGKTAADFSRLKILTSKPDGGVTQWIFSSGRLDLTGQSLPGVARLINQARAGKAAPPASAAPPFDRDLIIERSRQRADVARSVVAIVISVYFVTLAGMAIYLWSSKTTLLTPSDPRLWLAAKFGFFATFGGMAVWFIALTWNISLGAMRLASRIVVGWVVSWLTFGVMIGGWCYVAANVAVTALAFSGNVHHGAVLLAAEPAVSFHGRPAIYAHLTDRPGRVVLFTIDEADQKLLEEAHEPGVPDEPACVTVPVEWSGNTIRAEATSDRPLPAGSISACS